MTLFNTNNLVGRDSALRCPRRRKGDGIGLPGRASWHACSARFTGGDGAARHPYPIYRMTSTFGFGFARTLLLTILLGLVSQVTAADAPKTNAPAIAPTQLPPIPRSIFVIPTNANEGLDPFFPDSTRVFAVFVQQTQKVVDATVLTIKGFSFQGSHRVVIINNHSFSAGDEREVLTSAGRARVRCVEILPGTVLVEINGQPHTIHFQTK